MSDPYERAKAGRLMFKGGSLATKKSISKKKKKTKKPDPSSPIDESHASDQLPHTEINDAEPSSDIYTIDAAKKMKYDELFPVEARKFGYDPKAKATSVEQALDDRVKKKADRYCK